jgi:hypothetical protein
MELSVEEGTMQCLIVCVRVCVCVCMKERIVAQFVQLIFHTPDFCYVLNFVDVMSRGLKRQKILS